MSPILLETLYMLGGVALLALGGDLLIRGGTAIARNLKLSMGFVGVVLIGFGTSLPELAASIEAVRFGAPDVAIGNVVGSNIANLLLVVGVGAALGAIRVEPRALERDGVAMELSGVALALLLLLNALTPLSGLVLLLGLALYLGFVAITRDEDSAAALRPYAALGGVATPIAALLFGVGLAATLGGAHLLVVGATAFARDAGVPEAIIGATIVAAGTSLPELAATVVAVLRGRSELLLGAVFGSNIFNALGVMGAATFAGPTPTPWAIAWFDIWAMIGAMLLLLTFAASGHRISRVEGALLLSAYAVYLLFSAVRTL